MSVLDKERIAVLAPAMPTHGQLDRSTEKAIPRDVEEHMHIIASILFDILCEIADEQKLQNRHI